MIVRIEACFRNFWRAFNPDEWLSRLLKPSPNKEVLAAGGLVMIQIDGLGFTEFERARLHGDTPFLSRLIKKESYKNYRHYTGMPSNTPAVQGALFYGVKACVPAFGFKDSRTGEIFNMFNPANAAVVENRLKGQGEALLKDGSAYGNIFTGGAKEAHFCASSAGWGSLLKAVNPLGPLLTILLHLPILFWALFLIVVEFILAFFDLVRGIFRGKNFMDEIRFIPLRVAICVLLREVISAGARIDIARGLPVIHLNLAGYDEQAHHRGPKSAFAHWSLRGIDSVVAKVWKAAQRSSRRQYDVFIYSDHGQEETLNYQDESGVSIDEAVNRVLEERITAGKWKTEFSLGVPNWRASLFMDPEKLKSSTMEIKNKNVSPRAVVTAIGPVGHIYLPEKMLLEEKEKIAERFVIKACIPLVMLPWGPDKALAWTMRGKFIFPEEADKVIGTDHPFFKDVVRDLNQLCHHPDAGDFVIFGWKKGPKSLTFYAAQGSHAGPGPEETSGFALLPLGAVPRSTQKTVCTQDIREAAFRAQERKPRLCEQDPSVLRVMTYNVHGCMGRDGKISPSRIAGIIARHNPDIIALQELQTNEQAHQAQTIAQKLSMTCCFHASLLTKKGQRGNAVLSRYPMRLVRDGILPGLGRTPLLEPRGALWVEIDLPEKKIQLINTHLSLSAAERLLQMNALLGPYWLGSSACFQPVIFCGDFNALETSGIFKNMGKALKNTHFDLEGHSPIKTLPSFYPMGLVDHIFIGGGIKTLKIEVPKTELERISSDHLPLIVDLEVLSIP